METRTAAIERQVEYATRGTVIDPVTVQSQLVTLQDAQVDSRVDTRALDIEAVPDTGERWELHEKIRLVGHTPDGDIKFTPSKSALDQMTDRTGIDRKYMTRMLASQPDLAAINLNRWLHEEPKTATIRGMNVITEADGALIERTGTNYRMRAFLGSRYKMVNHLPLLEYVLPIATEAGALIREFSITDTHFRIRFTTPEQNLAELMEEQLREALGDQFGVGHATVNEALMFGLALSNSETGHGMIKVDPLTLVCHCTNLLITVQDFGMKHSGKRHDASDNGDWGLDTQRLDDAATYLKVRDRVQEVFSDKTRAKLANMIGISKGVALDIGTKPMMQWVANVGRTNDLTEDEVAILQDEVSNELQHSQVPLNRFAVSQGFTAMAQKVTDPTRRDEIQRLGWKVLTGDQAKLLASGAKNKKARRAELN